MRLIFVLLATMTTFTAYAAARPIYRGAISVNVPLEGLEPVKYEVFGKVGTLPSGLAHITEPYMKINGKPFALNVYSGLGQSERQRYSQYLCQVFGFQMGIGYSFVSGGTLLQDVLLIELDGRFVLRPNVTSFNKLDQLTCKNL